MRYSMLIAAVFSVLFGLAFVCPQMANWRDQQDIEFGLLGLGLAVMAGGIGFAVFGIKSARA